MMLWLLIIAFALMTLLILLKPLFTRNTLTLAITLSLLLPAGSILWYHHYGASEKVIAQNHSREKMIERLHQRAHQHPKNSQSWFLLGQMMFDQGQYDRAEQSFNQALKLEPNNTHYKALLAQAMYFNHHQELNNKAKNLLEEVLAEQPDNTNAINLLAVDDFINKRYKKAIKRWKTLLPFYPEDSEDGKALRLMIAKAQTIVQR